MIKQFIPEDYCLKCNGCCRFSEQDSVWSPCLLEEDIQEMLDNSIPPAIISMDKKIIPIPNKEALGYICPFLVEAGNKCKIYSFRPFECQLYPFLINLRKKKVVLTVDLNCPFIKENLNSKEFKEYAEYLERFLNSPQQLELLKDNPQIIQAYEDVLDVVELDLGDEAE